MNTNNININKEYLDNLIINCKNTIIKYRFKRTKDNFYTVDDFIDKFDKISPTIDSEQFTIKILGNYREEVDIIQDIPNNTSLPTKRIKKTKKQIYFYGKKDKHKHSDEEKIIIFNDILKFCTAIRILKSVKETHIEQDNFNKVESNVQKLMEDGF